ncbi:hypothetical protein OAG71_02240 [bacterium]|nr:hypothetical protein [bacterium]
MQAENKTDYDVIVAEFESAIATASRPYERYLQLALELRHLSTLGSLSPERAADFHARVIKATRLCKGKNFSRLKHAAALLAERADQSRS